MISNNHKKIIAVIPAYNEENSISDIILTTKKYIDHIIVYNDGSLDKTGEIALKCGVDLIGNSKRKGKGYALRCLFKEAIKSNPDIIITIDADGQHDPNEISKLIKPIIIGQSDMVIGSRFLKDSILEMSSLRRFGSRIINVLHNILFNFQVKDTQSGFRAFSKKAFNVVIKSKNTGYFIESEQLIIAFNDGIRVTEVPANILYNGLKNTSKMNFIKHGSGLIITLIKFRIYDILKKNIL